MNTLEIAEIKTKVTPILKNAQISKSAIFGSYARGQATTSSDIDILVEYPKGTHLFKIVELKNALEETLGKKVDLVSYSAIKKRLEVNILKDLIQIYE